MEGSIWGDHLSDCLPAPETPHAVLQARYASQPGSHCTKGHHKPIAIRWGPSPGQRAPSHRMFRLQYGLVRRNGSACIFRWSHH